MFGYKFFQIFIVAFYFCFSSFLINFKLHIWMLYVCLALYSIFNGQILLFHLAMSTAYLIVWSLFATHNNFRNVYLKCLPVIQATLFQKKREIISYSYCFCSLHERRQTQLLNVHTKFSYVLTYAQAQMFTYFTEILFHLEVSQAISNILSFRNIYGNIKNISMNTVTISTSLLLSYQCGLYARLFYTRTPEIEID